MKDFFILGAGFSKSVNDAMPVMRDLSDEIIPAIRQRDPVFANRLEDLGANVELWMSYLSQSQPWLTQEDIHYNLSMATFIRKQLRKIIDAQTWKTAQFDTPDWFDRLLKDWHRNKVLVATLNYDTLVERASRGLQVSETVKTILPDQIYPPFFENVDARTGSGLWAREPLETFTLLKLHGSMNWFYSGRPEFYGETILYEDVPPLGSDFQDAEERRREQTRDKDTLIIPPVTEKTTYFQNETVSRLWHEAAEGLKRAHRIFVIGYSLPTSDLGMRLFLATMRQNPDAEVFVVDVDAKLPERYRAFLRLPIKDKFVSQDCPLEDFVNSYPDQL